MKISDLKKLLSNVDKSYLKDNINTIKNILEFITIEEFIDNFETIGDNIEKLYNSINDGYIDFSEFIDEDYYVDNIYFYSTNEFFICEHSERIFSNEDMVSIHDGRNGFLTVGFPYRNDYNYVHDLDEYHTDRGLDYIGAVYLHDLGHHVSEDAEHYYHESDGNYYSYEERDIYINDYHEKNGYKEIIFSNKSPFKIGFEIEKEDASIKQSLTISEFNNLCPKWRKERDGSLCDYEGFELISPAFELNIKEIKKHIEGNEILINHINAESSKSCGGHINISQKGLTGEELFDNIKGYVPLFHALYYGRSENTYSKAKKANDLKSQKEKFSSFNILDNRVEIRIVSAVKNVNNLLWRAKLIEFILTYQTDCFKQAFFNVQTILKKHIQEIYSTPEKYESLLNRIIEFTLKFEETQINKITNLKK